MRRKKRDNCCTVVLGYSLGTGTYNHSPGDYNMQSGVRTMDMGFF